MTPFPDEDDEKWAALLGGQQLSAPALSDPSMRPQAMPQQAAPEPQEDPWQALADGLPTPPTMHAERDHGGLILAMFADAILNKGRSLGSLTAAATAPKPNADMQNYQMQRQHALDKAQIARMGRGAAGESPEVLALRARALDLRERGLDMGGNRLELDERKLDTRQENREEDQKLWDQRHGVGGVREQVAMNREGRSASEWDRRTGISEENKIGSEERSLGRELYKEERESERGAAQAAIPGWRNRQGFAPNKDNAKQAREIADSLGELEYFAGKLKETHGELNGLQAKLGANFNAFLGSDEAAQKLVDANIYHQQLLAAGRKLQNMGVPQLYELQMLEKGMPRLDSLTGILNAGRAYSTVGREAQLQAQRRMGVFGYEPDSGPPTASPSVTPPAGGGLGVTNGPVPKVNELEAPAQGGGPVRMRDPRTGKQMMVPAQNVETAKSRGLEVVQ